MAAVEMLKVWRRRRRCRRYRPDGWGRRPPPCSTTRASLRRRRRFRRWFSDPQADGNGGITGETPPPDLPHQGNHFVVEDFAVLDNAPAGLLVGHAFLLKTSRPGRAGRYGPNSRVLCVTRVAPWATAAGNQDVVGTDALTRRFQLGAICADARAALAVEAGSTLTAARNSSHWARLRPPGWRGQSVFDFVGPPPPATPLDRGAWRARNPGSPDALEGINDGVGVEGENQNDTCPHPPLYRHAGFRPPEIPPAAERLAQGRLLSNAALRRMTSATHRLCDKPARCADC